MRSVLLIDKRLFPENLFRGAIKSLRQGGNGKPHDVGKNTVTALIDHNVNIALVSFGQQVILQAPDFLEILQVMLGAPIRHIGASRRDSLLQVLAFELPADQIAGADPERVGQDGLGGIERDDHVVAGR